MHLRQCASRCGFDIDALPAGQTPIHALQAMEEIRGSRPQQQKSRHPHGRRLHQAPSTIDYALRAIISCLISPIALAGFRPFGQVRAQFMMVWQ